MSSTDQKSYSYLKTRFRQKKEWKQFRIDILQVNNFSCQLCGTKYSGKRKKMLNVHHLNESFYSYKDLNFENYAVLCANCHELVEKMLIKFKKRSIPKKVELYWELLFSSLNLLSFTAFNYNNYNYISYKSDNNYGIGDVYRLNQMKERDYANFKSIQETKRKLCGVLW